jgi:hypothetical protein
MKPSFCEEANGACRKTPGNKLSGNVREHECPAHDAQDICTLGEIEIRGRDAKIVGRKKHGTLPPLRTASVKLSVDVALIEVNGPKGCAASYAKLGSVHTSNAVDCVSQDFERAMSLKQETAFRLRSVPLTATNGAAKAFSQTSIAIQLRRSSPRGRPLNGSAKK